MSCVLACQNVTKEWRRCLFRQICIYIYITCIEYHWITYIMIFPHLFIRNRMWTSHLDPCSIRPTSQHQWQHRGSEVLEWKPHVPVLLRPFALTPPLVMPWPPLNVGLGMEGLISLWAWNANHWVEPPEIVNFSCELFSTRDFLGSTLCQLGELRSLRV